MDANVFARIEKKIPELLATLRRYIKDHPKCRRLALLGMKWGYSSDTLEVQLYFEDFTDLRSDVAILQNYGLIEEIATGNVQHFSISEELADYFTAEQETPATTATAERPQAPSTTLGPPHSEPDLERLIEGKASVDARTAARYLERSPSQISRLIQHGKLDSVGQGRPPKVTTKSLRAYKGS